MKNLLKRLHSSAGFSMIDTVITASIGVVLTAVAVPTLLAGMGSMNLSNDARLIERVLQDARLKAIQSNRTIRVMFNCPVAGQLRVVQLLGTQAVPVAPDGSTARCDEANYPYPVHDQSFYATTANDGPILRLKNSSFVSNANASLSLFEFWPDGTAHRDNGIYPLAQIA